MTSKARQVEVQLRLEDEQIAWLRLDVQNSAMAIFGNMEFLIVDYNQMTSEASDLTHKFSQQIYSMKKRPVWRPSQIRK